MTQITQIEKKITQIKLGKNFSKPGDRDPLTEQIIACCYKVHSELGPGFNENVYHNALRLVFEEAELKCETQKEYKVAYQGKRVGSLRIDLVVADKIIVEVKAVAAHTPELFKYQVLSYLKVSGLQVGLLVNFGMGSCEIKRLSH